MRCCGVLTKWVASAAWLWGVMPVPSSNNKEGATHAKGPGQKKGGASRASKTRPRPRPSLPPATKNLHAAAAAAPPLAAADDAPPPVQWLRCVPNKNEEPRSSPKSPVVVITTTTTTASAAAAARHPPMPLEANRCRRLEQPTTDERAATSHPKEGPNQNGWLADWQRRAASNALLRPQSPTACVAPSFRLPPPTSHPRSGGASRCRPSIRRLGMCCVGVCVE